MSSSVISVTGDQHGPHPRLNDAGHKKQPWVEPKLVAEIEFTTWTRDGRVRHPSFKGLREDKPAKSVIVETPAARDR